MITKGEWKAKTGQYQSGESLYLNRIYVGSCDWNSGRAKGSSEANNYIGSIFLPSIKNKYVYGDNPKEVRAEVEKIVNAWFNEALAEAKS